VGVKVLPGKAVSADVGVLLGEDVKVGGSALVVMTCVDPISLELQLISNNKAIVNIMSSFNLCL
jgi:hypothetical protein